VVDANEDNLEQAVSVQKDPKKQVIERSSKIALVAASTVWLFNIAMI
jgi:hypothetical protein